jgi:hypothetical protein
MSTPSFPRPESPLAADDSAVSGVSWNAVFAGAAAAAALSYVLVILGFGLGLSSVSPWGSVGAGAGAIGVATILWLTFTQVVASGMGGYLAGRLRVKWANVHSDEVYFRDTAHGFLSWAVASLLVAAFLASALGGLLSSATSAAGAAIGGAGAAAGVAVSKASEGAAGPAEYFVDALFRADPAVAAGATAANPGATDASDAGTHAEAGRIFATDLAGGSLTAPDQRYLAQVVAKRTGLAQPEAEQRVDAAFAAMKQAADTAKVKAKEVADQARKATAGIALWMFISLLCGAFAASLTATFGGRRRDQFTHGTSPSVR